MRVRILRWEPIRLNRKDVMLTRERALEIAKFLTPIYEQQRWKWFSETGMRIPNEHDIADVILRFVVSNIRPGEHEILNGTGRIIVHTTVDGDGDIDHSIYLDVTNFERS
jgi:hypothetical protein